MRNRARDSIIEAIARESGQEGFVMRRAWIAVPFLLLLTANPSAAHALTLNEVNTADFKDGQKNQSPALLTKAQVLLDRARFSPGTLDGKRGENFSNALRAFQKENGLQENGELNAETWSKLAQGSEPAVIEYTITAGDVKGPFADEIPEKMEKKAALKRLDYTGADELLAERFHMDEDLLTSLNPGKKFDKAGTVIAVANVNVKPVALKGKIGKLEVDKSRKQLRVLGSDGKLLAMYPASIGSEEKPAPSGTLKVVRVAKNPTYTYNPDFAFRGVKAKEEFKIAPGPNNPVGAVWIALNEKTYGIHGTPDPEKVGKAASHGCVRLTNWDALALAAIVKKGMAVEFLD
jgi:lipoprotein-anchoring transpeptidase ErfK/SrfK